MEPWLFANPMLAVHMTWEGDMTCMHDTLTVAAGVPV